MTTRAKAYPKELCDDVVAVGRKGQAPLSQIANRPGDVHTAVRTNGGFPQGIGLRTAKTARSKG